MVDRGTSAESAGTGWRLGAIGPGQPAPGSTPPRGTVLVQASVYVTPHTAAAAKSITGCQFAARDDRGRVWHTADSKYVQADTSVPDSCSPPGFGSVYIQAGHTQQVRVTFLVPAEAARSLRPMVRPNFRTRYLLFR